MEDIKPGLRAKMTPKKMKEAMNTLDKLTEYRVVKIAIRYLKICYFYADYASDILLLFLMLYMFTITGVINNPTHPTSNMIILLAASIALPQILVGKEHRLVLGFSR